MKSIISKERKTKIFADMDDVIETSKRMRNFLLDENKDFGEKASQLEFFRQAISANKSIVSATMVEISCQKLADYEE